jgi:hypothetical protein
MVKRGTLENLEPVMGKQGSSHLLKIIKLAKRDFVKLLRNINLKY